MIIEKQVFNQFGNAVANATVIITKDGFETDFSPLVSNELGVVSFDADEGVYEVKVMES